PWTTWGDLGRASQAGQGSTARKTGAIVSGASRPPEQQVGRVGPLSTLVVPKGCALDYIGAHFATLRLFDHSPRSAMLRRLLLLCAVAFLTPAASRALDCPSPEKKGQTPGGYTICKPSPTGQCAA